MALKSAKLLANLIPLQESYRQLCEEAERDGCEIIKASATFDSIDKALLLIIVKLSMTQVVFKGFHTTSSLQEMHERVILERTRY